MRPRSLILACAVAVCALGLFATPAEAGDCRKRYKHHHNYCRGGGDYGYYRPVRYYQPVRYVEAPYYYQAPAFQIGFAFGGGRHCR
jgi:hypothetical protein